MAIPTESPAKMPSVFDRFRGGSTAESKIGVAVADGDGARTDWVKLRPPPEAHRTIDDVPLCLGVPSAVDAVLNTFHDPSIPTRMKRRVPDCTDLKTARVANWLNRWRLTKRR